jgi:hypothetical protein
LALYLGLVATLSAAEHCASTNATIRSAPMRAPGPPPARSASHPINVFAHSPKPP